MNLSFQNELKTYFVEHWCKVLALALKCYIWDWSYLCFYMQIYYFSQLCCFPMAYAIQQKMSNKKTIVLKPANVYAILSN